MRKTSCWHVILNGIPQALHFHGSGYGRMYNISPGAQGRQAKPIRRSLAEYLQSFADSFGEGFIMLNNTLYLDTIILSNRNIAKNLLRSGNEKIGVRVSELLLHPMDQLLAFISGDAKNKKAVFKAPVFPDKAICPGYF